MNEFNRLGLFSRQEKRQLDKPWEKHAKFLCLNYCTHVFIAKNSAVWCWPQFGLMVSMCWLVTCCLSLNWCIPYRDDVVNAKTRLPEVFHMYEAVVLKLKCDLLDSFELVVWLWLMPFVLTNLVFWALRRCICFDSKKLRRPDFPSTEWKNSLDLFSILFRFSELCPIPIFVWWKQTQPKKTKENVWLFFSVTCIKNECYREDEAVVKKTHCNTEEESATIILKIGMGKNRNILVNHVL